MEFSRMPGMVLGGDRKLRFWAILGNTYNSVDFWRPDILESVLSQSQAPGTCLPSRGTGSWHLGWVPTSPGQAERLPPAFPGARFAGSEGRGPVLLPPKARGSPSLASDPSSVLPAFSMFPTNMVLGERSRVAPRLAAARLPSLLPALLAGRGHPRVFLLRASSPGRLPAVDMHLPFREPASPP